MNRRGVAFIEAACGILVLAGVLTVAFQYARVAAARLWLDHHLYNALVCSAEGTPHNECEQTALRSASSAGFSSDHLTITVWRNLSKWEGDYQWQGYGSVQLRRHMSFALSGANRDSWWRP